MTIIGDPAGMRATAAQLRFRAERCSVLASEVDTNAAATVFTGPAADRWRRGVDDQSRRLRAGATRLEEAADRLNREAAWVEEARVLESLADQL